MTWLSVPWAEVAVAVPVAGAAAVWFARDTPAAAGRALVASVVTLACAMAAGVAFAAGGRPGPAFAVDGLSAPLLPLAALLHLLTVLATARVKMNKLSLAAHLVGEALTLAALASVDPWPLAGLLVAGVVLPYLELANRGRPTRVYVIHMAAFAGLMLAGAAGAGTAWGAVAVLAAVLVRTGGVPAHLWVADLFVNATFGTALLYVAPLPAVVAAVRLAVPAAPDWALHAAGVVALVTAVYAAGLAVVQRDARRLVACLFLSHAALVLVGLGLDSPIGLTGALCLAVSVTLSVGGLGLTVRALEARHGPLALTGHRGLYDQSPALAGCFLLTGLGGVGFPGTIGFVAAELVVDGAVAVNPAVGVGVGLAAALNGMAVLRAYFALFAGRRPVTALPLGITPRERVACLTLAALIVGGGLVPQPGVADRHAAAAAALAARAAPVPTSDQPAKGPGRTVAEQSGSR